MNRLIVFFLFCISLFCVQVYSQDSSDDIVRVKTSLVVIPTRVVDTNGRFIPNLKKENFRVFEDRIEQEIIGFDTNDAPFTVALMLDVSDSTEFKLKDIQEAAISFLNQLRPNDKAIVFTFDSNLIKIYEGNAKNLQNLQESIRSIQSGRGTSLYDAVGKVVNNYLKKDSQRKEAIVVFTDGVDTASRETYLQSLRNAQESNALIYSIQYDTASETKQTNTDPLSQTPVNIVTAKGEPLSVAYKRGTDYLKLLSNNSGGRFYFADTVESLTKAFSQIASELSHQYSLSYYPQNQSTDGKKRRINVNINLQNAKVKARKTYIFNSKDE